MVHKYNSTRDLINHKLIQDIHRTLLIQIWIFMMIKKFHKKSENKF